MKNVTHLLAFVPIMLFVSCVQDTEPPIIAVSTSSADVSRETISVGLSASAAVSSGSKNILKTIPECGFYYGDDESLSKGSKVTASMNDDGSFSASVLPEEFGKTYYYQAYLNNGLGDNKSRNLSYFRTLEFEEYINLQSPQISFVPASGSATATVKLSTAEGLNLTDRGICYGETESPDDEGEWATISAGSGNTDFTVNIGQLQIGKKYYAHSFARRGDNIAYSNVISFNTDAPFKGLKITPSKDWTLAQGNSLDFQVFKINNDDTETEVTSSASWEYSAGTLSQNSVTPSRFTGTTKGTTYVKATYTESDWTESIQSDGMVTEATVIKIEYGKPQISLEVNNDIPAGGGDITKDDCTVSYFQNKTTYFSDGTDATEVITSPATVTFSPDKISGPNLKDTVTLRRIVDSIHVTVIMNGQDSTASAPVFQQENSAVDCTFKEPVVSVTVNKDIPASGDTINLPDTTFCTVSYYQIKVTPYTSGHEKEETITTGGQITFDPTDISKPSLSTTVTPRTKVGSLNVTVSMNGKSGSSSADVFQEANSAGTTYGIPIVQPLNIKKDIPACGGTTSLGDYYDEPPYSQTETKNYTSGASNSVTITSGATITYTDVKTESLGSTIKGRTQVGYVTAKVTMNGKEGLSEPAAVFQEENKIENASIQLQKSVLILDEETDATAAITFTSGATLHQGDNGVSLSAENSIVASCSNTGHVIGKSSTTNNTDYDYCEGQSTNIVLSYYDVPKYSVNITVAPKFMKLITDKTFSIRVNNWVSFDVQVQFQNIYNGSALNQAVTNYTGSLFSFYEPLPPGGGWINVDIECELRKMRATEQGEAQVYFSGSQWGQYVESDHNISIKGYYGSRDPKD